MQRILLVEDNAMNRDLISRRLSRRGFDVSYAVDGAEGVEKANADAPDLIIMDMGLPVLDGYEATRLLKEADTTQRIPIIGLSAHAMSGDAKKALEAGCDDYDTKPMDWKRLMGKIEALLEQAKEAGSGAGKEDAAAATAATAPKAHLLVVDDSALHREMLSGRLATLGYTFDLAEDPGEALDKLAGRSYDALLLDVTLPDDEGRPALERIRDDPRWRDLPILMLSTIDATSEAVDCLSRGAADFVPQPFRQEVLAARLDACLELRRLRDAQERLAAEERRSAHLLANLLPAPLVNELSESRRVLPRRATGVAVLSCDVAGFGRIADQLDPLDALKRLQRLIVAFEGIAERHGLTKVESAGGAFAAAAGLFEPSPTAALDAVRSALEMRDAARGLEVDWPPRFAVHQGPVVTGAIGHATVRFELFGGTVETLARVRRTGAPGAVCVTETVWGEISDHVTGERLGETKLAGGSGLGIYRVD